MIRFAALLLLNIWVSSVYTSLLPIHQAMLSAHRQIFPANIINFVDAIQRAPTKKPFVEVSDNAIRNEVDEEDSISKQQEIEVTKNEVKSTQIDLVGAKEKVPLVTTESTSSSKKKKKCDRVCREYKKIKRVLKERERNEKENATAKKKSLLCGTHCQYLRRLKSKMLALNSKKSKRLGTKKKRMTREERGRRRERKWKKIQRRMMKKILKKMHSNENFDISSLMEEYNNMRKRSFSV